MLTYKEMMDKYVEDGYAIDRVFKNDKWHNNDIHTPLKYESIYEYIGYVNIWNEVGCIENTFKMYRPSKGHGTIKYDDRKGI